MEESRRKGQHRWGMVVDLDKCTGCGACVVACSVENNQMLGSPEEAAMGRVIRWLKILPKTEVEGSHVRQNLIPMPCQQCENPPCIKVCPVYATFKNEEGIVGQVYSRCIGCRYCLNACPYTCKFFNWKKPLWPDEMRSSFNPSVSVRPNGVVEKCLFCHHRLQRAKEEAVAQGRNLQEGDYQPACAEVCPAKAIVFGDLNDSESDVSRLCKDPRAFHLLEELGTEPKVTYLREGV
ncbi:MAG: 4Fe-4S dicluster domain-containing protein [Elusimicrobia bacterium]|nr:4Fe-4S dicluster domain-containing protein [Elusimicrobiota bacterium]